MKSCKLQRTNLARNNMRNMCDLIAIWLLKVRSDESVCALSLAVACLVVGPSFTWASDGATSFANVARSVQPKVVKLYGAGGLRGLESYQSGILISDKGHVLTVWSYVLDADDVTVVLDDGRRYTAVHVAADPLTEVAVLKFDPATTRFPTSTFRNP